MSYFLRNLTKNDMKGTTKECEELLGQQRCQQNLDVHTGQKE